MIITQSIVNVCYEVQKWKLKVWHVSNCTKRAIIDMLIYSKCNEKMTDAISHLITRRLHTPVLFTSLIISKLSILLNRLSGVRTLADQCANPTRSVSIDFPVVCAALFHPPPPSPQPTPLDFPSPLRRHPSKVELRSSIQNCKLTASQGESRRLTWEAVGGGGVLVHHYLLTSRLTGLNTLSHVTVSEGPWSL